MEVKRLNDLFHDHYQDFPLFNLLMKILLYNRNVQSGETMRPLGEMVLSTAGFNVKTSKAQNYYTCECLNCFRNYTLFTVQNFTIICQSIFLLTVYHHNVQSWSHIIHHITHNAVEIQIQLNFTQSHTFPSLVMSSNTVSNTHILPSKQIFGPTTLAAPLMICKAKWSDGQTLVRLHFGPFSVAEYVKRKVLLIKTKTTHTVHVEVILC